METIDDDVCLECGGYIGPFVLFGDCAIALCLSCISKAHAGMTNIVMQNGPMAGIRLEYDEKGVRSFKDESGKWHWYRLKNVGQPGALRFVWRYIGENDCETHPPAESA